MLDISDRLNKSQKSKMKLYVEDHGDKIKYVATKLDGSAREFIWYNVETTDDKSPNQFIDFFLKINGINYREE